MWIRLYESSAQPEWLQLIFNFAIPLWDKVKASHLPHGPIDMSGRVRAGVIRAACVYAYQEGVGRIVTGWDRHVKNPLGLCCLSLPHTWAFFSFFPACYHLMCTKTEHTGWIICHVDVLSSFVTRSDMCSCDRGSIIFRTSLCTHIPLLPWWALPSFSAASFHIFICIVCVGREIEPKDHGV